MAAVIAERLIEFRRRRGWNRVQAAEAAGIRDTTLATWEKGASSPITPSFIKLADAWGVSLDWLTGRSYSLEIGGRSTHKADELLAWAADWDEALLVRDEEDRVPGAVAPGDLLLLRRAQPDDIPGAGEGGEAGQPPPLFVRSNGAWRVGTLAPGGGGPPSFRRGGSAPPEPADQEGHRLWRVGRVIRRTDSVPAPAADPESWSDEDLIAELGRRRGADPRLVAAVLDAVAEAAKREGVEDEGQGPAALRQALHYTLAAAGELAGVSAQAVEAAVGALRRMAESGAHALAPEDLVTQAEAARAAGVSPEWIRQLVQRGALRAWPRPGKAPLVQLSEVMAVVRRGGDQAPPSSAGRSAGGEEPHGTAGTGRKTAGPVESRRTLSPEELPTGGAVILTPAFRDALRRSPEAHPEGVEKAARLARRILESDPDWLPDWPPPLDWDDLETAAFHENLEAHVEAEDMEALRRKLGDAGARELLRTLSEDLRAMYAASPPGRRRELWLRWKPQ